MSIIGRETPLASLFVLYVHWETPLFVRLVLCTCTLYPSLLPLPPHCKGPSSRVPCQNPVFRQGWFPCAACDKPTAPHDDDGEGREGSGGGGGVGG